MDGVRDELGAKDVLEEQVDGPNDIIYCERYCFCGGVLRIRGRRYQLFGPEDHPEDGFVSNFEIRHFAKGGVHRPADAETALLHHALRSAQ